MTGKALTFRNGPIFDGARLLHGYAIRFENERVAAFSPEDEVPCEGMSIDLQGDILSPGYVDLQVNGGGGVMLNDDPSVDTLRCIAGAHRRLGVSAIMPTLITDTAEKTRAAIVAATEAARLGVPGIAGLHLEGPHLSVARKGAHDADLIRPMEAFDLDALLAASEALPRLMVTVAPENVTEEQVRRLASAGILVSLGHTDADFATCQRYARAGASCVTHLFNAMSQLGSRAPGLVGAALAEAGLSAGLIADGIHVHPETIRIAWSSKRSGPGGIYLVSDAMAVAGTDLREFRLEGRLIRRQDGRLTLADGTLAGADLDLTTALRLLVKEAGIDLADVLAAATTTPASIIGLVGYGGTADFRLGDMIRVASDLGRVSRAIEPTS